MMPKAIPNSGTKFIIMIEIAFCAVDEVQIALQDVQEYLSENIFSNLRDSFPHSGKVLMGLLLNFAVLRAQPARGFLLNAKPQRKSHRCLALLWIF